MTDNLDRALTFAVSALGVYLAISIAEGVARLFVVIREGFKKDEDRKISRDYIDALNRTLDAREGGKRE
jgi:hypothetical protein